MLNPSNKLYHEGLCDRLIDFMAGGMSFLSFGGEVRVGKTTLYNWEIQYPEFKEARSIGELKFRQYWEKLHAMGGAGVVREEIDKKGNKITIKPNASFTTFTLARRCREDYAEKIITEHVGEASRLIIDMGDDKKEDSK